MSDEALGLFQDTAVINIGKDIAIIDTLNR
jgi:hypothetical protein